MKSDYEKILEIGESFFSVQDAKGLLKLIIAHAKDVCDAERATLFLREKGEQDSELILRSYMATKIGGQLSEITVPADIGIVGHTFQTGEVQIENNVSQSPHFNPKIDEQTFYKTESIISGFHSKDQGATSRHS